MAFFAMRAPALDPRRLRRVRRWVFRGTDIDPRRLNPDVAGALA